MDPLEVFKINAQYAPARRASRPIATSWIRPPSWPTGRSCGIRAARAARAPSSAASASAIGTWGGGGHRSQCRTIINPDGSVAVEIGTQDLGTGTRTIITQVAAEIARPADGPVKLVIGNNDLPPDGASGGSTTVGGVSTSTRKSAVNALAKLSKRWRRRWARSPTNWRPWMATSR